MTTLTSRPALVEATRRLEEASGLDRAVRSVQHLSDRLLGSRRRSALLRGTWLGHALHPLMTDVPIGCWVSAHLLDLVGGPESRPAATRLVGLGLASALPTSVTGLAEWGVAERRQQRVGLVHAWANSTALTLYAASWLARRSGDHRRGVRLGLAGSAALGLGGYLGGHMVSARKVSSRHPAFADVAPLSPDGAALGHDGVAPRGDGVAST